MKNEHIVQKIRTLIKDKAIKEKIEILANVFIFEGVSGLTADPGLTDVNPTNITGLILQDRKENGETIHNSLALQGVTMMMWLDKK